MVALFDSKLQVLACLINFCPLAMSNETFSVIFKHRGQGCIAKQSEI